MIRLFCDRCGRDVTDAPKHGSIGGIEDSDENGNGSYSDNYKIVCVDCFAGFRIYMKTLVRWDKETANERRRRRAKQDPRRQQGR